MNDQPTTGGGEMDASAAEEALVAGTTHPATLTPEDAWWMGAKERDLNVTTNLDAFGPEIAEAYEYGRRDAPLPPEDEDTIQFKRGQEAAVAADQAETEAIRPLWEAWSEDEQGTMAAALAAAREAIAEQGITPEGLTAAQTTDEEVDEHLAALPAEPDLAAAGVLATGETVTADDLDGMPWYEARVEIYVRNGPPGDEYGVGGDKIAHTRAATQAPSFAAASQRLDAELGPKWQHLLQVAPLADQAPTPDPDPEPVAEVEEVPEARSLFVGWNAWTVVCFCLIVIGLMTLALLTTAAVTAILR